MSGSVEASWKRGGGSRHGSAAPVRGALLAPNRLPVRRTTPVKRAVRSACSTTGSSTILATSTLLKTCEAAQAPHVRALVLRDREQHRAAASASPAPRPRCHRAVARVGTHVNSHHQFSFVVDVAGGRQPGPLGGLETAIRGPRGQFLDLDSGPLRDHQGPSWGPPGVHGGPRTPINTGDTALFVRAFQASRAGSIPVARSPGRSCEPARSLPPFAGMIDRPRGVAQSGSAPGWGPGGRRFKSCLPD